MLRSQSLILICTLVLTAAFAAAQTAVPTAAPTPSAPRRAASPAGTAATQIGGSSGKWIEIVYSRPILRGRTEIFGKGADYGKKVNGGAPVWRAGANQTTRLKTEVPLEISGKKLAPGEYSLFVDLKEGGWTLIVSTQPYQEKYDPNDKVKT